MRGRILPLDDFGGVPGTSVLMLSLNPTEAALLLDGLEGDESTATRMLYGYLQVIADAGRTRGRSDQDIVNTDGRAGAAGIGQVRHAG